MCLLEIQESLEFMEFQEFDCFLAELGANPLSQNIFFESVPTLKIMLACFFEKMTLLWGLLAI